MTWIRKNTPSVVTNVGQKITRDPRDTGSRYRFNKPEATNMLRSIAVRSFIRLVEKFQSFEHTGKGGQENPAKQK